MSGAGEFKWWQKAVFYQIYPRSFSDGNGDGIGDLTGAIGKLDYLRDLGIDAIWLSPHYPSPNIDCGYDISDYCAVAPEYGNLEQFREFLEGSHERGIRVILDLVLNHTSDKHPWFIESRSSMDNPRRDWYIWKKGVGDQPPTNWYSTFGGSAWEIDPLTGEYYYHYFFKGQPDLNWKNPQVQAAMFNAARFWLDMGVDGFRLDAIGTIFEDEFYPQLDLNLDQEGLFRLDRLARTAKERQNVLKNWMNMFQYQVDKPEVHQVAKALRKEIDEYTYRVLVGETEDVSFYGQGDDEFHLNFNFPLMRTNRLTADHVRRNQNQLHVALPEGAWPCNTLGNHDSPRVFSNFGDGKSNDLQARLYLVLLLSLKGTPFLYNGEEIGMSDLLIDDPDHFKDPLSSLNYQLEKKVMLANEEQARRQGALRGRDKNRTPMQWENSPNAGFSPANVETWLPVNLDYRKGVNVRDQEEDPGSLLNFYRKVLSIRRQSTALMVGDYSEIDSGIDEILAFTRIHQDEQLLVLLNMADQPRTAKITGIRIIRKVLDTADSDMQFLASTLRLEKYQGCIFKVEKLPD